MQIWIDVYDSNYNRLGDGPIKSATKVLFKTILDSAGFFEITTDGTDYKATELLQPNNYIRIYAENIVNIAQFLGEGIIQNQEIVENNDAVELKISGSDTLQELKQKVIPTNKTYNTTLDLVLADLFSYVDGWTYTLESSLNTLDVQGVYYGMSIFGILQDLAIKYGFHLRMLSPKTIDIGFFGNSSQPRITKVDVVTTETIYNNELLIAQSISQHKETSNLYNIIYPVGSNGVVTLAHSTRTLPYAINSLETPNGDVLYYVSDSSSVATYGAIEKAKEYIHISPASNADLVDSANALYDAAVEDLDKHKNPVEYYKIRALNLQNDLFVGDKIQLDYKAQHWSFEKFNKYIDVQDAFWILDIAYYVDQGSFFAELTISSQPYVIETPARYIVDSIKSLSQKKPHKATYRRTYVDSGDIDSNYNLDVGIDFSDLTSEIHNAEVILTTKNLRGTSSYASNVSVLLDGVVLASNLNNSVTEVIDLTSYLSIGQSHNLSVTCESGEGHAKVTINILETTYNN